MLEPAPPNSPVVAKPPGEPDWLTDHPIYRDAKSFVVTAFDFTFRTRRFVERWVQGESAGLNPLTMVALSTALMAAVRKVAPIAEVPTDNSVLHSLVIAVLPYVHYSFVAAVAHLVLFPVRGRKRLRSTVAMMLYAAGGPLTFGYLLIALALKILAWRGIGTPGRIQLEAQDLFNSPWHFVAVVLIVGALSGFLGSIGRALAILHSARWWAVTVALIVAFIVSGAVYAVLGLPRVDVIFQPITFHASSK